MIPKYRVELLTLLDTSLALVEQRKQGKLAFISSYSSIGAKDAHLEVNCAARIIANLHSCPISLRV
jgi:hypothetical protein